MVNFEQLNRETRDYNNRNVDRYNPSTKSNYNYFNQYQLNNETYKSKNGTYSNYYTYNGGK